MKRFKVRLCRTTLEETNVVVQAEDRDAAIREALKIDRLLPLEYAPTDDGGRAFVMDVDTDVEEEEIL